MSFLDPRFFIFIVPVLLVVAVAPNRTRIIFLTLASYLFYSAANPWYCLILLGSTVVDYQLGKLIAAQENERGRLRLVCASVAMNIGLLAFFKYTPWLVQTFNDAAAAAGIAVAIPVPHLVLPIGISFYTFMALSYTIDIYRRQARPAANFLDFAFLISFFPHLVAGPILRANRFLPQIPTHQPLMREATVIGLELLMLGYFKKAVVADNCAIIPDAVFGHPQAHFGAACWLAAVLFAVQIYADFSGYTDIARGLARILGFDFGLNFRAPYLSTSIREFWRRWHISLSTWLRDYLYISLGGNRRGARRMIMAAMATWLLGGLWHGAALHFVAWGAYHGALVTAGQLLDRTRAGPLWERLPVVLRQAVTFSLVCLGWVVFRAENLADAGTMWMRMANPRSFFHGLAAIGGWSLAWLPALLVVHVIATRFYFADGDGGRRSVLLQLPYPARVAAVSIMAAVAVIFAGASRPFIYFAF